MVRIKNHLLKIKRIIEITTRLSLVVVFNIIKHTETTAKLPNSA